MSSRERVLTTLRHSEPERVPYDLGGTDITGINVQAYGRLLEYLGIDVSSEIPLLDIVQQLALVEPEVLKRLKVDTRGLTAQDPSYWKLEMQEFENETRFTDDWGVTWHRPKLKGHYYDPVGHPLSGDISESDIDKYKWPDATDFGRYEGQARKTRRLREETDCAIMHGGAMVGGMFELGFWLRGFENFYVDLASNASLAERLLDKTLELKLIYWEKILDEIGEYIDIAVEWDDVGGQFAPLISPDMYRKYVKPRHNTLFSTIKKKAPEISIFLHTCGNVRELIADFVEEGVDILNPIQVSAEGMDTIQLKKDFGKDIVFWGGGVDTQYILPRGTVQQVKDEVKKRLDDLAPGGGYVFAAVHNIQGDVPPENIMAMWETLQEYGSYR